jgi:hypothetical protein
VLPRIPVHVPGGGASPSGEARVLVAEHGGKSSKQEQPRCLEYLVYLDYLVQFLVAELDGSHPMVFCCIDPSYTKQHHAGNPKFKKKLRASNSQAFDFIKRSSSKWIMFGSASCCSCLKLTPNQT